MPRRKIRVQAQLSESATASRRRSGRVGVRRPPSPSQSPSPSRSGRPPSVKIMESMQLVSRYCCMGCQSVSADEACRPSHSIFSTYRAAAAHYTRSKSCQSSKRGIKIINLQFRDIDNDAGGAGGAGAWPQLQPAAHEGSKGENAVKLSHTTSHMISHLCDIACDKIKYPTRHRM